MSELGKRVAESVLVDGQAPQRRRLLLPKAFNDIAKHVQRNALAVQRPVPIKTSAPAPLVTQSESNVEAPLPSISKRIVRAVRKPGQMLIRAILSSTQTARKVLVGNAVDRAQTSDHVASDPELEPEEVVPVRRFAPQPSVTRGGKRLRVLSATAVQSAHAAVLAIAASQRRSGVVGSRRYLSTSGLVLRQSTAKLKGIEVPSSFKTSAAAAPTMSFVQAKREQAQNSESVSSVAKPAKTPASAESSTEFETSAVTTAALAGTGRRRIIISKRPRVLTSSTLSPPRAHLTPSAPVQESIPIDTKPVLVAAVDRIPVRVSDTARRATGFLKAMQSIRSQK
jgi:hypothetical protein